VLTVSTSNRGWGALSIPVNIFAKDETLFDVKRDSNRPRRFFAIYQLAKIARPADEIIAKAKAGMPVGASGEQKSRKNYFRFARRRTGKLITAEAEAQEDSS